MKRLIVNSAVIASLLILAVPTSAQTAQTLSYDYLGSTPAQVATWTQTITIDTTPVTTAPICTALGQLNTNCTVTIPTLTSGNHTLIIRAELANISAETRIGGLNPNNAPKNATNVKVIITQIVNIP